MRDYKTNNYQSGYKTSPEIVVLFIVFAYFVAELSWEQVCNYFQF